MNSDSCLSTRSRIEPLDIASVGAKIEARREQASLLLEAATHDSVKAQIHLAMGDLDEASVWLKNDGQPSPQSVLGLVDAILIVVGRRLDLVRALLTTSGPEAVLTNNQ